MGYVLESSVAHPFHKLNRGLIMSCQSEVRHNQGSFVQNEEEKREVSEV